MSDVSPRREWLIENFVHDGRVKFCPECRIVPAVALGRECRHGAGLMGRDGTPWVEEDVDQDRLFAVRNEDTQDGWYCFYDRVADSEERGNASQSETSSPQHWREQEWRDLICPICHRTTYGPEGNTYCAWHAASVGNVLMVSLLNAPRGA
jgi:hypothetical protein